MNFLQLCNDVKKESQQVADVEMTDVTGYSGILGHIPRWVNKAYRDVLNAETWDFLHIQNQTFNTSPDKRDYSTTYLSLDDVDEYDLRFARIYETSLGKVDESLLALISVDDWQRYHAWGVQIPGRPNSIMVYPDDTISLHPIPDKEYTIAFGYWKLPADLVAINDIPVIPTPYHDIIVKRALMKYAQFDDAPEIFVPAGLEYNKMLDEMRDKYLPKPSLHWNPLA